MMREATFVIALTWFLAAASTIICANATAADQRRAFDHTVYPQGKTILLALFLSHLTTYCICELIMIFAIEGCRCCWFIWKPQIRCGQVCCGDGWCSST